MWLEYLPLFLTYLATVMVAAATGILFKPGPWYAALQKPDWTPPNLAFPIIWTVLYLLMAVAATMVAGQAQMETDLALALWALQIVLNAVWSPVFFGLHNMRAGLLIIRVLWLAVAATIWAFWLVSPWAGLMLVPYLAWVSVAAALNRALIGLNPQQEGP